VVRRNSKGKRRVFEGEITNGYQRKVGVGRNWKKRAFVEELTVKRGRGGGREEPYTVDPKPQLGREKGVRSTAARLL